MNDAAKIHAQGVCKRYRKQAVLNEFDFTLAPGRVTVLLGRNGAGKSTFLKMALGVVKPDAGQVSVFGLDPVRQARRVRQAIGYVPDKPDVYGWMTVRDFFRYLRPHYPTWCDDRAVRLVETLAVPDRTPFRGMSRGEGMKAMLVAALAHDPELLLLDEPFAGLDPVVREEVLRTVIGEWRAGETTVLCTTHDLDVAARIADRLALLDAGRISVHDELDAVIGGDEREVAQAPARMKELLAGAVA